jgi:hypothetical protein
MVGIAVAQRERRDQLAVAVQEWIGGDHQRADLQLWQGGKHRLELA